MLLPKIFEQMQDFRIKFWWRDTLNWILKMPTKTREDRFRILLEILTVCPALWIDKLQDPEYKEFDIKKFYSALSDASAFCNNQLILKSKITESVYIMASEFINDDGLYWDFEKIPWIFTHKLWVFQFLERKTRIKKWDTGYVFKAKSWEIYRWEHLGELVKLNTAQLTDILHWLDFTPEGEEPNEQFNSIHQYILNNEEILKFKFLQYRLSIIAFLQYIVLSEWNEITIFILDELKIPHPFVKKQIRMKKAKQPKQ